MSTPEEDRAKLAADYPDWEVFRRGGLFCAWWPPMPRSDTGLLVLRDRSVDGLRARLEVFTRVWDETHNRNRAEAAAIAHKP